MTNLQSTPLASGFKMPARFEEHDRTLITWPPIEENVVTDVPGFRHEIESIARRISKYEPVTILVDPKDLVDATQRCAEFAEIFSFLPTIEMIYLAPEGIGSAD